MNVDVMNEGVKLGSFYICNNWFKVYDLEGNMIYDANWDFWGYQTRMEKFEKWALYKLTGGKLGSII